MSCTIKINIPADIIDVIGDNVARFYPLAGSIDVSELSGKTVTATVDVAGIPANTTVNLAWRNMDDPAAPGSGQGNAIGGGFSSTGRSQTTSGSPSYTGAKRIQPGWYINTGTGGQFEILGGQIFIE